MDALCLDDLDRFGTELDDPIAELYQDLYHRLLEEPGSNLDDPDRGYGLVGKLSSASREGGTSPSIKHGIESEMLKDNRVHEARATITSPAANAFDIKLVIVADEGVLDIKLVADAAGVRRVA